MRREEYFLILLAIPPCIDSLIRIGQFVANLI